MPYRMDVIDPQKTAVILVDMQNDFVESGAALQSSQAHAMVPKLATLLETCCERGMRVI